ncbi:MAG TPA: hypothetical protein VGG93_02075 [Candidatus Udaeobacter sp.]
MQVLFHGRQTQAGVLSDLLVASPLAGQLRNFPFALCEPGDAWQPEKPESPRVFLVSATIFAGDEKMWSRHADGIDLLELNCREQMRGSRMTYLFFFEICALLGRHSTPRIHPFSLENAASIQNLNRNRRTRFCSFRVFGSFLPQCAELARGIVLLNRPQAPTQDYRGERQTPEDFFKIRSHATLALERFDPAKGGKKLRVQLPEQFHLRR